MQHTYIISTQWDHYPFKGGYQRTVCRETQKTAAEAEQKRDGKRKEGDIKRHCSKAQMQYGMDGGGFGKDLSIRISNGRQEEAR